MDSVKAADHINFSDADNLFKDRKTWDLFKSLVVFQLCQYDAVVETSPVLLKLASKFFITRYISNFLVKKTFFWQFCGGEDEKEVAPVILDLSAHGIDSILDLSVESDQDADYTKDVMEQIKACIKAAATDANNSAAVKVTALGSTKSLLNASGMMEYQWDLFQSRQVDGVIDQPQFADLMSKMPGVSSDTDISGLFKKADVKGTGKITWPQFIAAVNIETTPSLFVGTVPLEKLSQKERISVSGKYIPILKQDDIKEFGLFSSRLKELCDYASGLNVSLMFDAEQSYFQYAISYISMKMMAQYNKSGRFGLFSSRLKELCDYASGLNVSVMLDAEQSYFQYAISYISMKMMAQYNKSGRVLLYNTYQLYLKDSLKHLQFDYERSQQEGFKFGAKLVRGAYMVLERKRAKVLNVRDPIHENKNNTDKSYSEGLHYIIPKDNVKIVVATHNRTSINEAISISKGGSHIMFAQLYGMYDYLTYKLADEGYKVAKYIPYGPVEDVIPYLIRRAQENKSVLKSKGDIDDLTLIKKELKRRFFRRKVEHKE
ncbi:hypothetical protein MP638_007435 [Amoeboaphelidium occidentale]|nr:hypothetical protein MP638_007435 [Amoeboaphelidium occidentale]